MTVSLAVAAAENNTRVGLARSMASAGARAYNGGLGSDSEPPAGVQGQSPRWGVRGGKPPEADGILVLLHSPGGFLHSCKL